jgi:hypothetical protein
MIRGIKRILGCCLILILRKGECNELTGHPMDRGKSWPNSRSNSLQPGEDDANQLSNSRRPSEQLLTSSGPIALHFMIKNRGRPDGHKSYPDGHR